MPPRGSPETAFQLLSQAYTTPSDPGNPILSDRSLEDYIQLHKANHVDTPVTI